MQRRSRAVGADGGVAGRNAFARGELLERHSVDLDLAEDVGVLGLECARESRHAGADLASIGGRTFGVGELPREGGGRARGRPAPPRVVGRGVAQQPEEPRDGRLRLPERRAARERLREGVLKEILGRLATPHATLEEAEERAVVFDQELHDSGRRCTRGIRTHADLLSPGRTGRPARGL